MNPEQVPNSRSKEDYLLSSVKTALRILQSFSVEEPEKKVSQIAMELGIGKSSVSRMLATLASEGFVKKDPDSQKYQLGLKVLSLGGIVKRQLDLSKESRPSLMKLVKSTGESAFLAVLEGTDVVYIEQIESSHPIRLLTYVGQKNPAFCTSTGKVLLSHQKEDFIERVIANGLTQYTKNTITDPQQFREYMKSVREKGYAMSCEELSQGIISIAAPIRNYSGKVVAAVSVAGPVQRIHRHQIENFRPYVLEAAKEISEKLGYSK